MREEHVGFLIVHRQEDPLQKPVGVLTDRDLVLGVMARDVDPHAVTVDDVMTVSRSSRTRPTSSATCCRA